MGCMLCISVPEYSVTPLETWGKFTGFADPGCNYIGCCTQGGTNLDLSTRQTNVKIGTRTKDNVFVTIDLAIQWAVIQDYSDLKALQALEAAAKPSKKAGAKDDSDSDVPLHFGEHDTTHKADALKSLKREDFLYRAAYKALAPVSQLQSHAEEYFRITVAKYKMDKLFDLGLTITKECTHVLNTSMNEFGFLVKKVVIRDILPEDRVRKAMNDIVASQKERDSQINRAEADKLTRIKGAEADAEVSRLHGEGIALQRQAIIGGLRKSVEDFATATHSDTQSIMQLMMMTQHTDMVKESIKEASQVSLLLSASPTSATDLEHNIRDALSGAHHRPSHNSSAPFVPLGDAKAAKAVDSKKSKSSDKTGVDVLKVEGKKEA